MPQVLLAVGTAKGAFLFRSDEKRTSWEAEGPLFKGWEVTQLTIDPRREGRLFATIQHKFRGFEIHRSEDFGKTWTAMDEPPSYPAGVAMNRIWGVFPGHAESPDRVFAGVDPAGLFVSDDGGRTWREVEGLNRHETRDVWLPGYGGLCCHTVRCDPFDPQRIWACISVGGLFRSDDGGATWAPKTQGVPLTVPCEEHEGVCNCIHNLAVSPNVPGRLFQQNHGGLFRSSDAGESWQRIEEGLSYNFGLPLAVHPDNDQILLAAPIIESDIVHLPVDLELYLQLSTDGGDNWQRNGEGLPSDGYMGIVLRHALAIDDCDALGVEHGAYVGTTSGDLYFSRDGIRTWQTMPGFHRLPRILSVQVATFG